MAMQSDRERDDIDEMVEPVEVADGPDDQGAKRRGRAARRRRQQGVTQTAEISEPGEQEIEVAPRVKEAPTPGRRQKERSRNVIARAFRPLTTYLQETMVELRKVTWPTREDAMRLSGIVLATTVVSAVVLGFYNYLLTLGLELLLRLIP